jgi:hypothetical protein
MYFIFASIKAGSDLENIAFGAAGLVSRDGFLKAESE